MSTFVGSFSDLGKPVRGSRSRGRYNCPYCDTVHGKSKDENACVTFDQRKQTGICFRCKTIIVNDGLADLDYILEQLKSDKKYDEREQAEKQKLKIDWTLPIMHNYEVWNYMHERKISNHAIERFNVRSCSFPLNGVVFVNKLIDNTYTDFFQIRVLTEEHSRRHAILRDLIKKACWLHLANTPNLIICEGFAGGLSAYQHTLEVFGKGNHLNPVVLLGTSITDIQLSELKTYCSKYEKVKIWVCLDGGFFEDTLKVAGRIFNSCYNSEIKVVPMPFDSDPNDLDCRHFLKTLRKSLSFEPSRIQDIRNKVYNKVI